jgi:hypothetical protein
VICDAKPNNTADKQLMSATGIDFFCSKVSFVSVPTLAAVDEGDLGDTAPDDAADDDGEMIMLGVDDVVAADRGVIVTTLSSLVGDKAFCGDESDGDGDGDEEFTVEIVNDELPTPA